MTLQRQVRYYCWVRVSQLPTQILKPYGDDVDGSVISHIHIVQTYLIETNRQTIQRFEDLDQPAHRTKPRLSFQPPVFTMIRLVASRATSLVRPSYTPLLSSRPFANAATDVWKFNHQDPAMTKIVCTIGPSTDTASPIQQLVDNGMSVARLNFSHAGSDYTYPEACLELIRNANGRHSELSAGATFRMPNNLRAVLVDTKGPEIRTGPLQGNADVVELATGCVVEVTTEDVSNDPAPETAEGPHRLNVDYQSIASTLKVGSQVLLDDGLIALQVTHVENSSVTCTALNGGPIKKNKGVNLPDAELDLPALTDKDKRDLKWAVRVGADFVAASFIRTGANVRSVKAYLDRCAADLQTEEGSHALRLRPLVISKIESKEGVDNFDEILKESDGIMVARGDLGVEIPFRKVFAAQKMMVEKCNAAGKPVSDVDANYA